MKSEYFRGHEVRKGGEDMDRNEEKGEDAKRNENKEAEEEAENKEDREQEEDVERSDNGEELREKGRTEGDVAPEAETDREQRREEPTSRRPCDVPGEMWLHKVRS
ncbi:hypothetical protein NDU88_006068 [Pleurodeles waltl]|uniref:Uncharacterized protein n=1 Tax=Pleurodeles waltl TaxID=8319 RepID=A0AAV7UJV9_PLEWA|nr:hypothetical protein NDU88_006068 [Pleurodeles waltl]